MNAKPVIVASLLAIGYILPAAAQSAFFIVRDPATRHCSIVDKRPVTSETTVVNPDGTTYTTRTEAETAMKTVKICSE